MRHLPLLAGTAILLALAAFSPKAALADASPAEASQAVPVDYQTLLRKYIAARPALADNPGFVESYARYERCGDWRKLNQNEFKYKPFLDEMRGEIAAEAGKPMPTLFLLKTNGRFGHYDFDKSQFEFHPFQEGSAFGIPTNVNPCGPFYQGLPQRIVLRIANPWLIDGLPMSKDKAQQFVDGNPDLYSRQVGLDVVLRVDRIGDVAFNGGSFDAGTDAEIVSASIDDGAREPKTLFTLDDAYMRQRKADHEQVAKQEAAVTAGSVEATPDRVLGFVQTFLKTPDEMPKLAADEPSLRLLVNLNLDYRKADNSNTYNLSDAAIVNLPIYDNTSFTPPNSGVAIRLDNSNEFKGVTVPADVLKFVSDGQGHNEKLTLFVKPTGYVHDQYLGTYMMGHIAKVAIDIVKQTDNGPAKKTWVLESSQPLKPYNPLVGCRTDFEILGVKAGMAPDEVRAAAEKELGQTLVFDEKAMILSSPPSECEFTFDSQQTPPGRKCFKAEFRIVEKGLLSNKLGLARATYRQAVYKKAGIDLRAVLADKYGPEIYYATFDQPAPATAQEAFVGLGGDLAKVFREWGKRQTLDRNGMISAEVHVPVHALEAEIDTDTTTGKDITLLTLTLTGDLLAGEVNGVDDAAAAARKADEDRKKSADMKL